jgi:hypothetical protein
MNTSQDDGNEQVQPKLDQTETTFANFEIETDRADQPAKRRVEDPDVEALDRIKLETQTLLSTATQITKDWLASGVIGFFVVSYWRGTWTFFDIWYVQCTQDTLRWECNYVKEGYPSEHGTLSHTIFCPCSGGAINQNKLR